MGVLARIILRVIAGFLIARGLPEDLASILQEPDLVLGLELVLGAGLWAVTEGFYWAAKRFGWQT